jgi:hypothetical protein
LPGALPKSASLVGHFAAWFIFFIPVSFVVIQHTVLAIYKNKICLAIFHRASFWMEEHTCVLCFQSYAQF